MSKSSRQISKAVHYLENYSATSNDIATLQDSKSLRSENLESRKHQSTLLNINTDQNDIHIRDGQLKLESSCDIINVPWSNNSTSQRDFSNSVSHSKSPSNTDIKKKAYFSQGKKQKTPIESLCGVWCRRRTLSSKTKSLIARAGFPKPVQQFFMCVDAKKFMITFVIEQFNTEHVFLPYYLNLDCSGQ